MRAGLAGCHAVTFVAVEGDVYFQRLGPEAPCRQRIENMMRVERAVIIAHAGMIAPDDQVRAAEVLAQQRVQQRLARARVAHLDGIARLHDRAVHEIVLDERIDRPDPGRRRDIARFQRPQHLVNQYAIADLDGDLGQVLVAAVHRVARLESRHRGPAFLQEQRPRLRRSMVEPGVGLREVSFRQRAQRPAEIDRSLRHDFFDTGVCGMCRAIHMLAFELPVDAVLLLDGQNREQLLALAVNERDVLTNTDAVAEVLPTGQGNRYRPEQPVCECHVLAARAPVCLTHKAIERRISAHAEHAQVRHFAAG